ncbi:hypothetical protein ACT1U9_05970 [Streptomyces sp. BR1]|uniref:hypothetical protein n=1 Tax=Streptomyces sp. BR1 TaxID=1592323 RepID=UPI00402BF273
MTSLIRKLLIVGGAGALAAAISVPALASAPSSRASAGVVADAATAPPSTVEDFEYPGAAKLEADKKIKLIKGDGHILLADSCDGSPEQIKVWKRNGGPDSGFCFRVTAKTGYLTLKIDEVWALETGGHPISADLSSDGGKSRQTVDVNIDVNKGYKSVGEGTTGEPTMLVELRVTG